MNRWICVLCTIGAFALFFGAYAGLNRGEVDQESASGLLRTLPAPEAYTVFKKNNANVSIEVAHTNAHLFGEALFEKSGIEGFSVCDSSFGFGCYHSFIARAISEKGEEVIPFFDAECTRVYGIQGLGCSHGIGHGVLSFYGYNFEDLQKSLEVCSLLSWKNSYGGCKDGVFMEYNLRVMEPNLEDRLRPFTESKRHEPCDSLTNSFTPACYFSQPEWWMQHFGFESGRIRIAGYCSEVTEKEERAACFRGFGYAIAARTHFDAREGRAACDSSGAPREGVVQCREGLAWALYADPQYRESVSVACAGDLFYEEEKRCMAEYLFVLQ